MNQHGIVAHACYSAAKQTHNDTMPHADAPLPPIPCLMGPTACGKTAIAVRLVEEFPFEIISVDSALVYRGLDIGSGKPDAATQARAPHHLIDIRDPAAPYSAADFRTDALAAIKDIQARGKVPLLTGGTMLYFRVLRDGLADMPAATPEVRQRILEEAGHAGWPALHRRLHDVDPDAAARIHANDPQRLQRALEVYEVTGKPLSELQRINQNNTRDELPGRLLFLGLVPRYRAELHERIATRFHAMLADGLVDEVRRLRERGDLSVSLPAIRSVGYRQVWEYLDGHYDYATMVERAIAATRQLAKRQLTWLRGWKELHAIPCGLSDEDYESVSGYLKNSTLAANYW